MTKEAKVLAICFVIGTLGALLGFASVPSHPRHVMAQEQELPDCSADHKICVPEDYPGDPPEEIDGRPTVTCGGTCKLGQEDPCAEVHETSSCAAYCDKDCCICRKVHCP